MHDITIPAALIAGLVSFLSPCVLPLVPPYLIYLTGATIEQVNQSSHEMRQTAVVLQSSAQKVRVDAGKLQKLVGQFETSEEGKRAAAA